MPEEIPMMPEGPIPENIRSLLDRAEANLRAGQHGDASTLFWQAAATAIRQAAQQRGQKLVSEEQMAAFIERLDPQVPPGFSLLSGYLNALEFKTNGAGHRMDRDTVAFYEPVIHSFIKRLLGVPV